MKLLLLSLLFAPALLATNVRYSFSSIAEEALLLHVDKDGNAIWGDEGANRNDPKGLKAYVNGNKVLTKWCHWTFYLHAEQITAAIPVINLLNSEDAKYLVTLANGDNTALVRSTSVKEPAKIVLTKNGFTMTAPEVESDERKNKPLPLKDLKLARTCYLIESDIDDACLPPLISLLQRLNAVHPSGRMKYAYRLQFRDLD